MTTATPEAPAPEHAAPQPPRNAPKNFWGTSESKNIYLAGDSEQFFVVKKMNEGDKTKFQKLTNQDMVVDRNNEARVKVDPAAERHGLINSSVIDWHIYEFPLDGSDPYLCQFSKQQLKLWLENADPKVVADLEHEIRLYNPWMLNEMPIEELDREIDRLEDMKKRKIEQEAGEASSTNK